MNAWASFAAGLALVLQLAPAQAPAYARGSASPAPAVPKAREVWHRAGAPVPYVRFPLRIPASRLVIHSLLVVCTGNICRSPMAEALFAERARARGTALAVGSAGVAALVGYTPPEPVLRLMGERGLDVSGHRARQLTNGLGAEHELILVMEQEHRRYVMKSWPQLIGRVRRLGEWRGEDVFDPYGLPDDAYSACLAHIEGCVDDWERALFG